MKRNILANYDLAIEIFQHGNLNNKQFFYGAKFSIFIAIDSCRSATFAIS